MTNLIPLSDVLEELDLEALYNETPQCQAMHVSETRLIHVGSESELSSTYCSKVVVYRYTSCTDSLLVCQVFADDVLADFAEGDVACGECRKFVDECWTLVRL